MIAFVVSRTTRTSGPIVPLPCPACHDPDAVFTTLDERVKESYLGFIPVNSVRVTVAVCSGCRAVFHAKPSPHALAEAAAASPELAARELYFPASFLQMAVAVIALAVAIFPLVGTVFAVVALAMTWSTRRWPKRLSWVALWLSLAVFPVLVVVGMIMDRLNK